MRLITRAGARDGRSTVEGTGGCLRVADKRLWCCSAIALLRAEILRVQNRVDAVMDTHAIPRVRGESARSRGAGGSQ